MREDNTAGTDMAATDSTVRHVHHHAYACWDSEETRHFYEDILGMPLVAAFIATSRSKWREMQPCGSSSASWTRPAWRTCSWITERFSLYASMIQTV